MPLSALKLGEALADRLNEIIPGSMHVSAEAPASPVQRRDADVFVRVAVGEGPGSGQGFSDSDLPTRDDLSPSAAACDMAVAMISGVQDSVSRILQEPWPQLPTGGLALPDGRAEPERLYLWYGLAEESAVLRLRPVSVREISIEQRDPAGSSRLLSNER
jgi:hypothetical protein